MSRPALVFAQLPSDLRQAFDDLVANAVGEFGPTPLARLMLAHLVLFAELRRRGASWAQIAALLSAHGIVGDSGAFTADMVRATYARAAKTVALSERDRARRNATKHNAGNRNDPERSVTERNAAKRSETRSNKAPDAPATAKPQDETAPTPPGAKRASAARDATGEHKSDLDERGLADLFRRAAFLSNPANRR